MRERIDNVSPDHRHKLVFEPHGQHKPHMEPAHNNIRTAAGAGIRGDTPVQRGLQILSELLHILVLHEHMDLGTLAAGTGLYGPSRHQHAAADNRSGRGVAQSADQGFRLHKGSSRRIHCRTLLSGMVGHEQPRGMGRQEPRLVV